MNIQVIFLSSFRIFLVNIHRQKINVAFKETKLLQNININELKAPTDVHEEYLYRALQKFCYALFCEFQTPSES